MGLIKNIFGTIFGLIGGIFGAIGGLLGLGKKSDFFLELDEKGEAPQITEAKSAPEAKTAAASAPAKVEASTPAAAEKTAAPAAKAPTPQPAMAAAPAKTAKTDDGPTNFATDYLVNPKLSNGSRRRPGPSLSPFKDLARQVKTPTVRG